MAQDRDPEGIKRRHSRVPFDSAVHMVRAGNSWTTDLIDISATGILVERPRDWIGQEGDVFVVDLVVHDRLDIHVEATVARISRHTIGLEFSRIPPDKERDLWALLGENAHRKEPYE